MTRLLQNIWRLLYDVFMDWLVVVSSNQKKIKSLSRCQLRPDKVCIPEFPHLQKRRVATHPSFLQQQFLRPRLTHTQGQVFILNYVKSVSNVRRKILKYLMTEQSLIWTASDRLHSVTTPLLNATYFSVGDKFIDVRCKNNCTVATFRTADILQWQNIHKKNNCLKYWGEWDWLITWAWARIGWAIGCPNSPNQFRTRNFALFVDSLSNWLHYCHGKNDPIK